MGSPFKNSVNCKSCFIQICPPISTVKKSEESLRNFSLIVSAKTVSIFFCGGGVSTESEQLTKLVRVIVANVMNKINFTFFEVQMSTKILNHSIDVPLYSERKFWQGVQIV